MHIVSNNALESLKLCFVTFKLLFQHFMWNKTFSCHTDFVLFVCYVWNKPLHLMENTSYWYCPLTSKCNTVLCTLEVTHLLHFVSEYLHPKHKCSWLVLVLSYRMCLMFLKWNKILLQTSRVHLLLNYWGNSIWRILYRLQWRKKKHPFSFLNSAGSSQLHQAKHFSLLLQDQART